MFAVILLSGSRADRSSVHVCCHTAVWVTSRQVQRPCLLSYCCPGHEQTGPASMFAVILLSGSRADRSSVHVCCHTAVWVASRQVQRPCLLSYCCLGHEQTGPASMFAVILLSGSRADRSSVNVCCHTAVRVASRQVQRPCLLSYCCLGREQTGPASMFAVILLSGSRADRSSVHVCCHTAVWVASRQVQRPCLLSYCCLGREQTGPASMFAVILLSGSRADSSSVHVCCHTAVWVTSRQVQGPCLLSYCCLGREQTGPASMFAVILLSGSRADRSSIHVCRHTAVWVASRQVQRPCLLSYCCLGHEQTGPASMFAVILLSGSRADRSSVNVCCHTAVRVASRQVQRPCLLSYCCLGREQTGPASMFAVILLSRSRADRSSVHVCCHTAVRVASRQVQRQCLLSYCCPGREQTGPASMFAVILLSGSRADRSSVHVCCHTAVWVASRQVQRPCLLSYCCLGREQTGPASMFAVILLSGSRADRSSVHVCCHTAVWVASRQVQLPCSLSYCCLDREQTGPASMFAVIVLSGSRADRSSVHVCCHTAVWVASRQVQLPCSLSYCCLDREQTGPASMFAVILLSESRADRSSVHVCCHTAVWVASRQVQLPCSLSYCCLDREQTGPASMFAVIVLSGSRADRSSVHVCCHTAVWVASRQVQLPCSLSYCCLDREQTGPASMFAVILLSESRADRSSVHVCCHTAPPSTTAINVY